MVGVGAIPPCASTDQVSRQPRIELIEMTNALADSGPFDAVGSRAITCVVSSPNDAGGCSSLEPIAELLLFSPAQAISRCGTIEPGFGDRFLEFERRRAKNSLPDERPGV